MNNFSAEKRSFWLETLLILSDLVQISLVTDCTVRHIGELPFYFSVGTCGSFMIYSLLSILLCFHQTNADRKCQSLTRRKDGPLSDIEDFVFDAEFEVNKVAIPDSAHPHWLATIANYRGFPLVLGGVSQNRDDWEFNNKLEILNTIGTTPTWIEYEGTEYPYSNT